MSPGDAAGRRPEGPGPFDDLVAGRAALAMLRRVGGEALAREMVALHVDALPGRLAAVRAALVDADREALARTAHALKASCGQLGGAEAARLCREVETRAGDGDLAAIGPLVDQVERACVVHRAWLDRALAADTERA